MKFNLIGFSDKQVTAKNRTCIIHQGTTLIPHTEQPDLLFCPLCGTSYQPKDTAVNERFNPKFGPSNKTAIVTAKKKKKYYDKSGNEITDPTLIQDILQGVTVISYHEQIEGTDSTIVKRK